jgi:hypothetical protein
MHRLQKFSAVHAPFHNHFNQERHRINRKDYEAQRSAALAAWRAVMRSPQGGFGILMTNRDALQLD